MICYADFQLKTIWDNFSNLFPLPNINFLSIIIFCQKDYGFYFCYATSFFALYFFSYSFYLPFTCFQKQDLFDKLHKKDLSLLILNNNNNNIKISKQNFFFLLLWSISLRFLFDLFLCVV